MKLTVKQKPEQMNEKWIQLKKSLHADTEETCIEALKAILEYRPGPLTPQKVYGLDCDLYMTNENPLVRDYNQVLKLLVLLMSSSRLLPYVTELFVFEDGNAALFQISLTNLTSLLNEVTVASTKADSIIYIMKSLFTRDFFVCTLVRQCLKSSYDVLWRELVQQIISLPIKLGNKLKMHLPALFSPENYAHVLLNNILKSVVILADAIGSHALEDIEVKPLSLLLDKILVNFECTSQFERIICAAESSCASDSSFSNIFSKMLLNLEGASVSRAAVAIFSQASHPSVSCLLSDVMRNPRWKYCICDWMFFKTYYERESVVKNLVTYLKSNSEEMLMSVFEDLLYVWSDRGSITLTPIEQRVYLSKAIVLCALSLDSSRMKANEKIQRTLFMGVPVHLESTNEKLRAIGMIVAELVMARLNPNSEHKIVFEYDGLRAESKAIVECLRTLNSAQTEIEKVDSNVRDLINEYESQTESWSRPVEVMTSLTSIQTTTEKKESDAARPLIVENHEEEEEEWDSDDELEPYDLSNDLSVSKVQQPKYLRDLINGLLEKTNADVWIGSLEACGDLVKTQLHKDDPCIGIELLSILLTLDRHFYMENFDNVRFEAAVAIVNTYPEQCATYLSEQFHEPAGKFTISHKMFMLDVLAGSARELSSLGTGTVETTTSKQIIGKEESEWKRIIRERIEKKTKYKSLKKTAVFSKVNDFNSCAGSFFYPLLRGSRKYEVISPQNMLIHLVGVEWYQLLVHYVDTLAVIMCSAVNCVAAPNMASELLEFTKDLRFHVDSSVRASVLRCIAAAIISVPKATLWESNIVNEIIEIREWLQKMVLFEVSSDCRKLASQVLSMIKSVY